MQHSETQQVTEITETGKLPFGGSLVKGQQWHQWMHLLLAVGNASVLGWDIENALTCN